MYLVSIIIRIFTEGATKEDESEVENKEESSINSENLFNRVTRSGSIVQRITEKIKQIEQQNVLSLQDSMECLVGCGRKKSLLLLPCRHQYTCEYCWIIWKIQQTKQIPDDIFDHSLNDDEENMLKPKCPVCKSPVDQEINAFN